MPPRNYISISALKALANMRNIEEHFPNGLKVSKAQNPMFFPVESAYQVGSAEILALMSNTIPVGTGQTGDAPLYIFCKDGVYAAFVDASGEMVYPNTRPLAPDVCNNARSVTMTDLGVVFTTDRGLMRIAGYEVQEIGQPAEGDVLNYADSLSPDYIKIAKGALTKVAGLPLELCDHDDFLTYLQGAIINYNHNFRELIVTNPSHIYSYVLDREGNWSRRDYTALQFVNNYPTSYRVTESGEIYKLDEEGDSSTSLEQKKESENNVFYLSNVIKLDSIGFKQAMRFVVRGYFETITPQVEPQPREVWQPIGYANITNKYTDKGYQTTDDILLSLQAGDKIRVKHTDSANFKELTVFGVSTSPQRILFEENVPWHGASTETYKYHITKRIIIPVPAEPHVGIYVLGSYDGRKWACLGGNERYGKFTDIGCRVERTDVKFFRVCLAGQITGQSRIDYMEISSFPSVLNTKIR